MPVFNAQEYVGQAIESILNQTFKDFDLIIADDASTDNSWQIINKYKKKDSRIRIFKNKENKYIAENRNILLSHVKCKYIAWQDADDISMPDRLLHEYEYLEDHPEVGIVGGYLQFFNDKGNLGIRKYAPDDSSLRKQIFMFSPVAQPAAMIRRELFSKIGKYNLKYPPAEDIDMSFRIGTMYKFANLQEVVLKYRESDNSATYKNLRTIESNTIKIRMSYLSNSKYPHTFLDILYNLAQLVLLFTVPASYKIRLFNFVRNSRY